VGAILNILCPRERRVFQSKLGVSSSNQCNLHHSPHTGHLKKNKKGYNLFRTRCILLQWYWNREVFSVGYQSNSRRNKLVNTQNVSVTKMVDSSSIQCAESKYGLRIHFLALVVMIHEVWLNA